MRCPSAPNATVKIIPDTSRKNRFRSVPWKSGFPSVSRSSLRDRCSSGLPSSQTFRERYCTDAVGLGRHDLIPKTLLGFTARRLNTAVLAYESYLARVKFYDSSQSPCPSQRLTTAECARDFDPSKITVVGTGANRSLPPIKVRRSELTISSVSLPGDLLPRLRF